MKLARRFTAPVLLCLLLVAVGSAEAQTPARGAPIKLGLIEGMISAMLHLQKNMICPSLKSCVGWMIRLQKRVEYTYILTS